MSRAPHRGLAVLCLLAAASAWAEPLPGAGVEELLVLARQQSPEFQAMRLEAEAAAERVGPAGALADPMVRVELQNVTNEGAEASPNLLPARVGGAKYTLIQPLPWWGKRDLKRQAAEAAAQEAQGRADGAWNDLAARIKTAYALYFQASRQLQTNREVLDLMDRLESIARIRYGGGLAPQADAIRAQVERTAMQAELIGLETERHHAMLRINALLARPAAAPLAEPKRLRALPADALLDASGLASRLRQRSPQLFAEAARVRTAESNRDLAYRNRYPDLALGVSPMQSRNRVESWELMLELNIPLQQASRRSQEREAERMTEAARARSEATANQLLAELGEALAVLANLRRTETLAEASLLPQAELAFQSALAGYETGRVDFATVLDAQRQIRRTRLDLIKNRAEQQMRLADIERLVGEDL